MRHSILIAALSLILFVLSPAGLDAQVTSRGSFQWLGRNLWPTAVSPDGRVVVGESIDGAKHQAFRWDDRNGLVMLPGLSHQFIYSGATGVSNNGAVIVGYSQYDTVMVGGNPYALIQAVRWTYGGAISALSPMGFPYTTASGVSSDGNVIIGEIDSTFITSEGSYGNQYFNFRARACKWSYGTPSYLPGIDIRYNSYAYGVSPDGSVIVGSHETQALRAQVATKWTPEGMSDVGLTYPPYSQATCVSLNGEFIGAELFTPDPVGAYRITSTGSRWMVGDSAEVLGITAEGGRLIGRSAKSFPWPPPHGFVWDASTGIQTELKSFCQRNLGIILNNTSLSSISGISADGTVIVGQGVDSLGQSQGFRIRTGSSISVWYPRKGSFWEAGRTDTIRWTCFTHFDSVAVLFSTDSGATMTLIASSIPGDSGSFAFRMPDDVMSTKCKIIIIPYGDTARGESGIFKAKGIYLTRLNADGQYEKFERLLHAFTFGNEECSMWPQTWWQQFDYKAGLDPFTGWAYPGGSPWDTMKAGDFTDWPTFVKAFDVGACYFSLVPPVYKREAEEKWSSISYEWFGSCAGIASTALMAFDDVNRFRSAFPAMGVFSTISELACTDDVRGVINEVYDYQFGAQDETYTAAALADATPTQTVQEIRKVFLNDAGDDRYLAIYNNGTGGGGHAIVPYKLAFDSTTPTGYWISVYDNSFTGDYNARIFVDTTANDGQGLWSYSNFPMWGGPKKLFLDQPVSNYFHRPVIGKAGRTMPPAVSSSPTLQAAGRSGAFSRPRRSILIADPDGRRIGFHGDSILTEIPGANPIIAKNAREGPPVGYDLPRGQYTVGIDQSGEPNSSFTLFGDSSVYKYDRSDAAPGQTDLLTVRLEGGLTVTNNDPLGKSINLEIIAEETASEKVYRVENLSLLQGDSIALVPEGGDRVSLRHQGVVSGTFNLLVERVSRDGVFRFIRNGIAFPGNATCRITPDWNDFIADTTMKILIDHGNKGSFDDSVIVDNQTKNTVKPMPGSVLTVHDSSWVADGEVFAVANSGITEYIGGSFTAVGPATGHAAILDISTGTPDLKFPKINGNVSAIVSDSAGGWYIGGSFTNVGGVSRRNCVHINADRSVDANWNPAPNKTVNAFVRAGSVIYAGGSFDSIDNQPKRFLAALDPATGHVTDWSPAPNKAVALLAVSGGTIYAGGSFDTMGSMPRISAAALDAVTGAATDWNPAPNHPLTAIVPGGAKVYMAGTFSKIGGQAEPGLAVLDTMLGVPTTWHSPGISGSVKTLYVSGANMYIGGAFSKVGDSLRNNIAALDTGTGLAASWNPNANGEVDQVVVSGTAVYLGGMFTAVGSIPRNSLAAIDGATGLPTGWSANTEQKRAIAAIATNKSELCAGGGFTMAGGTLRNNAAALDVRTGRATAWNPNLNGIVRQILPLEGSVYLAGDFTTVGSRNRKYLVQVDSVNGGLSDWSPDIDGTISALAADGHKLYVGGGLKFANGYPRANAAAFDLKTGALTNWMPNPDGRIYALAADGGRVYAGGYFGSLGNKTRSYIGAVDTALGVALDWNPGVSDQVYVLCIDGDNLYAGGKFFMAGGITHNHVAAIDKNSGDVSAWSPNFDNPVNAIAVANSAVYVGGNFYTFNGLPRRGLAAIDKLSGLPTTWSPAVAGWVNALNVSIPLLFAGGNFSDVDSTLHSNFARFTDPALVLGVMNPRITQQVPLKFVLEQNFPNPFNPQTTIQYSLPVRSMVSVRVYNILGQLVKTVAEGVQEQGSHSVQWNASGLASGVYFYHLSATGLSDPSAHYIQVRKMILVR